MTMATAATMSPTGVRREGAALHVARFQGVRRGNSQDVAGLIYVGLEDVQAVGQVERRTPQTGATAGDAVIIAEGIGGSAARSRVSHWRAVRERIRTGGWGVLALSGCPGSALIDPTAVAVGCDIISSTLKGRGGGIGRHAVLRGPWAKARVGSSPALGTKRGAAVAAPAWSRLWSTLPRRRSQGD